MFRYKLRTLLIVLALGPVVIWLVWLALKLFDWREIPLIPSLAAAVIGVAAGIYLFVPPPGRGQPSIRMLLVAVAVLFVGLAALGLFANLIDYGP